MAFKFASRRKEGIPDGRRISFVSVVTAMTWLLLRALTIIAPGAMLLTCLQYQNGQIHTEAGLNAELTAKLIEKNPDWLAAEYSAFLVCLHLQSIDANADNCVGI